MKKTDSSSRVSADSQHLAKMDTRELFKELYEDSYPEDAEIVIKELRDRGFLWHKRLFMHVLFLPAGLLGKDFDDIGLRKAWISYLASLGLVGVSTGLLWHIYWIVVGVLLWPCLALISWVMLKKDNM